MFVYPNQEGLEQGIPGERETKSISITISNPHSDAEARRIPPIQRYDATHHRKEASPEAI